MRAAEVISTLGAARRPRWREFLELTKPRVVALMLFTVLVGMMMSTHAALPWDTVVFGTLGIVLVAAGAAAVNHLVDRRIDAVMARTRARPLPRGTLAASQVAAFALLLSGSGMAVLLVFTNPLCAWLTFASLIGYAVVYSLFLKHATPQNIVIGGAAGAAPPLLGWVAVSGQLEAGALLLFLIIFVWTPPHFWALAIHRRDDYARAGVPMLPVTHGIAHTSGRILAYSIALVAISAVPVAIGMSGWLYLAIALPLGLRFIILAWKLRSDARLAMPTFRWSIVYLAGLFAALLLDHFLASFF
ncbi:heme o synthase [Piscinibacter sakaiensis]|uniref:heme o synthase n=1 Tax=Piscinibacter sakaiensis TaxID=1547922 RepID=UPI003AAEA9A7